MLVRYLWPVLSLFSELRSETCKRDGDGKAPCTGNPSPSLRSIAFPPVGRSDGRQARATDTPLTPPPTSSSSSSSSASSVALVCFTGAVMADNTDATTATKNGLSRIASRRLSGWCTRWSGGLSRTSWTPCESSWSFSPRTGSWARCVFLGEGGGEGAPLAYRVTDLTYSAVLFLPLSAAMGAQVPILYDEVCFGSQGQRTHYVAIAMNSTYNILAAFRVVLL